MNTIINAIIKAIELLWDVFTVAMLIAFIAPLAYLVGAVAVVWLTVAPLATASILLLIVALILRELKTA